jgi:hypothetical protein
MRVRQYRDSTPSSADEELDRLARELAREKRLRYSAALRHVARERPDFVATWRGEIADLAATTRDAARHRETVAKNRESALSQGQERRKDSADLDHRIDVAAKAYRKKHAYSRLYSTRALAEHLARTLDPGQGRRRPAAATIRRRLHALNIE